VSTSAETRLVQLADILRAIATNGLHWATDPHDRERYERTLAIAAELLGMTDTRNAAEIERLFRGNLELRSPFVTTDAAIFDHSGRILLIQRADNGRWAMPGGAAEVGETPSEAVVREVREETKLDVVATRLVGVYDSRRVNSPDARHLYHLVFLCEAIGGTAACTAEAVAVAYVAEEDAPGLPLLPGHGPRITDAFRAHREPTRDAVFH
jgi:ADP-ribose pyrophosphatase YjhB (NUDIX family)